MENKSNKNYEVWHPIPRYDRWLETLDIPVYREYFVEDLRTLRLGPWQERECNAAIVVFAGQEGVSEARVSEIPPGATLPAFKFTLDEYVYVLEGRGLTTVWTEEGSRRKTFEWQKHSFFVLPRGYQHRLSNAQGSQPARLLHFNCLPLVMAVVPNPQFFFNNPSIRPDRDIFDTEDEELFSEAKLVDEGGKREAYWVGNFFPDLKAWDKLRPQRGRGGASVATLMFPGTGVRVGLPTMPVGTYKKAHRHGAGIVIVIPGGEGMSVMWPEGGEKQFFPWHEGSAFVPPSHWYHQHFNLGPVPGRYIAIFPPRHQLFGGTRGEAKFQDDPHPQIEYTEEDPAVRRRFGEELRKRRIEGRMPPQCYVDSNYEWAYAGGGDD